MGKLENQEKRSYMGRRSRRRVTSESSRWSDSLPPRDGKTLATETLKARIVGQRTEATAMTQIAVKKGPQTVTEGCGNNRV